MKMLRLALLLTVLIGIAPVALAQPPRGGLLTLATPTSGTLAATYHDFGSGLRVLTLSWTCTTGGQVLCALPVLTGTIERVVTNPTDAPADDYDVILNDADDADLLCGLGANRDTTTTESFVPKIGNGSGVYGATTPTGASSVILAGASTLQITAAGSAKSGVIRLYLRKP